MREKDIEQYLVKRVREAGGRAYKWVSPGNDGVPDRIVMLPGVIAFVELKAPGKKPTPRQLAKHRELERLGRSVTVIDSREQADDFIEALAYLSKQGVMMNEIYTP